jgi:hypothetical protein
LASCVRPLPAWPVKDLCRSGFSESSYYARKANFGGMNEWNAQGVKALDAEGA